MVLLLVKDANGLPERVLAIYIEQVLHGLFNVSNF